jgi:hypothetical protein
VGHARKSPLLKNNNAKIIGMPIITNKGMNIAWEITGCSMEYLFTILNIFLSGLNMVTHPEINWALVSHSYDISKTIIYRNV